MNRWAENGFVAVDWGSTARRAYLIDGAGRVMDEIEDMDSADILTAISRGVDKWLWFVEAHQQTAPGAAGNGVKARAR